MLIEEFKMHKSHGDGDYNRELFKKIGDNVVIEKGVLVFHQENISLGDNIYIGHYTILKGYYKNEIIIGNHTWIGQGCFIHGAGGLKIGKAVGIGPMVKILTSVHEHKSDFGPVMSGPISFAPVLIEDGADVGVGSIILPGIRIGEGAIIGAGSVVTKEVKPFSIVAGNPARLLRMRNEK